MIIFLFLLLILMLIRFKLQFIINLENTKSHIEIYFLFFKFSRSGKFKLKPKNSLRFDSNNKKSKNKSKTLLKIKIWFLKKIKYDELIIDEKIGIYDPALTALIVPLFSTLTMISLNYLIINYNSLKYKVDPEYNNLILKINVNAKASFRLIDLIMNNNNKIRTN